MSPVFLCCGIIIISFIGVQTKSVKECPPEPDCPTDQIIIYPDLSNCSQYILCTNGYKNYSTCPVGLHFNKNLNACDYRDAVNCDECLPAARTTDVAAQKTILSPIKKTASNDCHTTTSTTTVSSNDCPAEKKCPTIADGVTEWNLTLLPVPWDCTQYIMCQRGDRHYRPCPAGLHFNKVLSVCDWPKDANCEECDLTTTDSTISTTPVPTSTTPIPSDTTAGKCPEEKDCPTIEDGVTEWNLTLLPVPSDCTQYIMCQRGYRHYRPCPAGLHFNKVLSVCDWPKDANCEECDPTTTDSTISTTPVPTSTTPIPSDTTAGKCPEEKDCPTIEDGVTEWNLTLLPVPSDCTQYIMCQRGYRHYRPCPAGLHFNKVLSVCDWPKDANCEECDPTTTDSTISTTPVPTSTTPIPSDTTAGKCPEEKDCPTIEDGVTEWNLTLLPVPSDCTQYIMCQRGYRHYRPCPAGLHFNKVLSVCDWPKDAHCKECDSTNTDSTISSTPLPTSTTPITSDTTAGECPEEKDCPTIDAGVTEWNLTLLPVPSDCTQYIMCQRGYRHYRPCPAGLHFNKVLSVCDWPKDAHCEECDTTNTDSTISSTPLPTSTTPITSDTTAGECPEEKDCPTIEAGVTEWNLTLLPVPSDCTQYIMCQRGYRHYRPCSAGLHFNKVLSVCDWPKDANCEECDSTTTDSTISTTSVPTSTTPIPSDTTAGKCPEEKDCPTIEDGVTEWNLTLLPVPSDCTQYIMCQRGYRHYRPCPAGLHFNKVLSVCDWPKDANCEECDPTTTDSTISTTPVPTSTTPIPSDTTAGKCPEEKDCPTIEDGVTEWNLTLLPVPSDCTQYIMCQRGYRHYRPCPAGLHFNKVLSVCDWPKDANCKECDLTTTDSTISTTPLPTSTTPITSDTTAGECPEEKDCPTIEAGVTEWNLTLLPVPSDCTQYIMCQRGYRHYRPCPAGLHFNKVLSVCDWPKDANCEECDSTTTDSTISTTPVPTSTTPIPSDTTAGKCPEEKDCPTIEDGVTEWNLTLLPVPSDCTQYIMCQRGYRHYRPCPAGLHFNKVLSVCDWPKDANCEECDLTTTDSTISTTPVPTSTTPIPSDTTAGKCPEENDCPTIEDGVTEWNLTLLPVPSDCTQYIMCQRGYRHYRPCPAGLHFNKVLSVCDWPKDANCEECDLTTTDSTISTTPVPTSTTPIPSDTTAGKCPEEKDCPTIEDGVTEWNLTLLPVPSDCTQYIMCQRGYRHYRPCPAGLHFNKVLSVCDWPKDANCEECDLTTTDSTISTTPVPTSTTPIPSDTTPGKCPEEKDCPTIEDGVTEWNLTLLPVPSDCTQYIMCQRGYRHYRPCPAGLHFNKVLSVCDWPKDANCEECDLTTTDSTISTTPVPTSTTPIPSDTTAGKCPEEKDCPTIEDGVTEWNLTLLPVPSDCTQYIMCQRGYRHYRPCPAGLHFNKVLSVCDWPKDANCKECDLTTTDSTISTTPLPTSTTPITSDTTAGECPEEKDCPTIEAGVTEWNLTLLPVPSDCTQYIMCQRGYRHYRPCPAGLHFNKVLSVCDWPKDANCKECDLTTTDSTISTTPVPTSTTPIPSDTTAGKCPEEKDCPTIEDGVTEWNLTLLPVPSDCTQYIMCQRGYRHYRPCPAGLHFNKVLSVCDWPKDANCEECDLTTTDSTISTTPVPTSTTPIPSDTTAGKCPEEKDCPTIEDGVTEWNLTLLPVPSDCTQYIMCQRGYRHYRPCPAGLHFNKLLSVCDWPKDANCDECDSTTTDSTISTTPVPTSTTPITSDTTAEECPEEKDCPTIEDGVTEWNLTLLPVPSDCTQYIMCQRGYRHYRPCPAGLHFNKVLSVCDWPKDANCEECDSTTTDSTISTTPVPTSTTPIPSDTTAGKCPEEKDCPTIEDGVTEWNLTLLPVPSDCTQYIMCQRGYRHYRPCPAGLHFNKVLSVCDWPKDANCEECDLTTTDSTISTTPVPTSTTPIPSDTTAGKCREEKDCPTIEDGVTEWNLTLLPVPSDCTQYIMCQRGYRHYRPCPAGLHFNKVLSVCDWPKDANCEECDLTTTDSTISTTPVPTSTTPIPSDTTAGKCPEEKDCPTIEDGVTEWNLTLLPVPSDCTQYIMCQRGYRHYRPCPAGLHFNKVLSVCDWPMDANCEECDLTTTDSTISTTPVPTSTTPIPSDTTAGKCPEEKDCPTIEDGVTEWNLTLLPVPSDCTQYIMCQRGYRHYRPCPAGLHFNKVLSVCDWPKDANCEECDLTTTDSTISTTPVPTSTTPIPSDTTAGKCPEEKDCPTIEDGVTEWNLTLLPVPSDCTQYIMCQRGYRHYRPCPAGLHFNKVLSVCDWPKDANCKECDLTTTDSTISTTPLPTSTTPITSDTTAGECPEEMDCPTIEAGVTEWNLTLLPVPSDCTQYIMCQRGYRHYRPCPAGLHFNKVLSVCDWPKDANCKECDLTTTDSTISTTPVPTSTTPIPSDTTAGKCPEEKDCPTIEDGVTEWNLTLLPVPSDCTQYIMCQRGYRHYRPCPAGLHFNKVLSVCDWPKDANCEECDLTTTDSTISTTPVPTSTTPIPSDTTAGKCPEEKDCPTIEDGVTEWNLTLLPVPSDCTQYIMCQRGYRHYRPCPAGLHFNKLLSVCDWPKDANCEECDSTTTDSTISTTPVPTSTTPITSDTTAEECPEEKDCPTIEDGVTEWNLTLLPVPSDCTQYIMCQRGYRHYRPCPAGLHFNKVLSVCDWPKDANCEECFPTTSDPTTILPPTNCDNDRAHSKSNTTTDGILP